MTQNVHIAFIDLGLNLMVKQDNNVHIVALFLPIPAEKK